MYVTYVAIVFQLYTTRKELHKMVGHIVCSNCDEQTINTDTESMMFMSSIQTFSSLMAVLLAVGFFSNVYIFWITTCRRFPVCWETFRLILRYSSIVDFSLCAAIVWIVLRSLCLFHAGGDLTLTIQCAQYSIGTALVVPGAISGIVAIARQVSMLLAFDEEVALLNQNRSRTMKLLRYVVVITVVSFVSWILLNKFAPDYSISMCFVTGGVTSRATYVLLVPVVVNVGLGVVVITRPTGPVTGCEQSQTACVNIIDLSYKAKLAGQSSLSCDEEDTPVEITDSRRKRFVIVSHVGLATWLILAMTTAVCRVLMSSIDINDLAFLCSSFALTSAWSAFVIFNYWK